MKTIIIIICFALISYDICAKNISKSDIDVVQSGNNVLNDGNGLLAQCLSEDGLHLQYCTEEYKVDSTYEWLWNENLLQWEIVQKVLLSFDVNGNLLSRLTINWNGSAWVNLFAYYVEYDENNNMVNSLFQTWNGINWVNSYFNINTYDGNNQPINELYQSWNGTSWENSSMYDNVYDENRNPISQIFSLWQSMSWVYKKQQINAFDDNNNNTNILLQEWDSGWKNKDQFKITFDANNDRSVEIFQQWVADEWEDKYMYEWIFDNNHNPLLIQTLRYDGNMWLLYEQEIYNYNLPIEQLRLTQRYINNEWINDSQNIFRYNSNQNIISAVIQNWEDKWINDDSTHFYYSASTDIKDLIQDESGIFFYPNPAINSLHLKSYDALMGDLTIEIYSDTGVKVKEVKLNSSFNKEVDISGLIPGLYHVLIQTEKGFSIKSFVKM